MGRESHQEVRDGSEDPPGGSKQFGDPRGGLGWIGDTTRGPERVREPSRRSKLGRETFPEVWDGSDAPSGSPEGSGDPPESSKWVG